MLLDIPRGNHMLELKFEDTPVRRYGKIISLVSIVIFAYLILREKKTRTLVAHKDKDLGETFG